MDKHFQSYGVDYDHKGSRCDAWTEVFCCCAEHTRRHVTDLGLDHVEETNAWKPDRYIHKFQCEHCKFIFFAPA